jgi:lipopolysaccharide biosynthesis glycosyltransferase
MHVGVAITSLLVSTKGKCRYDIYCVVPESVDASAREELGKIVSNLDAKSKISFVAPTNDYDDVEKVMRYGTAMFYRLLLHKVLPHLNKVIYYDHDIIFQKDLRELWAIPLGNKIIAAVKGGTRIKPRYRLWKESSLPQMVESGGCITSGALVLNLAKIRKSGIDKQWLKYAKMKLIWPDQDILNASLYGKVVYLPATFSCWQCSKNPNNSDAAAIHFGGRKPWGSIYADDDILLNIWWGWAMKTPFFFSLWRDWMTNVGAGRLFKYSRVVAKFLSLFVLKKRHRKSFLRTYARK